MQLDLAFEDVDLGARIAHIEAELGAEIDDGAFGRVDAETFGLRRHVGAELATRAGGLAAGDELELGGAFDQDAGTLIKLDLRDAGLQFQQSGRKRRARRDGGGFPFEIHAACEHGDGGGGVLLVALQPRHGQPRAHERDAGRHRRHGGDGGKGEATSRHQRGLDDLSRHGERLRGAEHRVHFEVLEQFGAELRLVLQQRVQFLRLGIGERAFEVVLDERVGVRHGRGLLG